MLQGCDILNLTALKQFPNWHNLEILQNGPVEQRKWCMVACFKLQ